MNRTGERERERRDERFECKEIREHSLTNEMQV